MANSDYYYEDLIFLGKSFSQNNFTKHWSYNYLLKINKPNVKLNFYDGEVEKVYWYKEEEIIGLIKKDQLITEDSIDVFSSFINSRKSIK